MVLDAPSTHPLQKHQHHDLHKAPPRATSARGRSLSPRRADRCPRPPRAQGGSSGRVCRAAVWPGGRCQLPAQDPAREGVRGTAQHTGPEVASRRGGAWRGRPSRSARLPSRQSEPQPAVPPLREHADESVFRHALPAGGRAGSPGCAWAAHVVGAGAAPLPLGRAACGRRLVRDVGTSGPSAGTWRAPSIGHVLALSGRRGGWGVAGPGSQNKGPSGPQVLTIAGPGEGTSLGPGRPARPPSCRSSRED